MQLLVVAQVGFTGEALITEKAGEGLLFGVNAPVADELRGHAEGLAAFHTLVALGLDVNAPVVLQCHQVGEFLLAHGTVEGSGLVAVLVVEQRSGVSIRTSAVLTHVTLLTAVLTVVLCLGKALPYRTELRVHFRQLHLLVRSPSQALRPGGTRVMVRLILRGPVELLVLLETGHVGEVLLTHAAVVRQTLAVHLHVALQVRILTKRLPTVRATVARHLQVALELQGVGEGLETEATVQEVGRMSLFMV